MRCLVLCKRKYTGKDLLDDRYGRLWNIPVGLAALGYQVKVVTAAYRSSGDHAIDEAGVSWVSVGLWPWPLGWLHAQYQAVRQFQPDVILASSDALHLVAGAFFGRRFGVPVVLDLYDDYEAFTLTRLPGLRIAMRRAIESADGVVAVSHTLAEILPTRGSIRTPVEVIGNGVPEDFAPACSKAEARAMLGLPEDAALIGTAGSLSASRGIGDLLRATERLRSNVRDLRLVVAGPRDADVARAFPGDVIDLGLLPHATVPIIFRALDVGVVCNRDSTFGRACFPQKLVEMIACGLPLVAADIGEASVLLKRYPDALYTPGNVELLADRIAGQLESSKQIDPGLAETWSAKARRMSQVLDRAVRGWLASNVNLE